MLSGAPRWADNAADSGSDSFTCSEAAGSLGPRRWLLSQSCPKACGQRLCVPSAFLLEHVWAPEGQWATPRACSLLLEVGGGKGLYFSSHKGGGAEAWNVGVRSRRPSSEARIPGPALPVLRNEVLQISSGVLDQVCMFHLPKAGAGERPEAGV